MLLPASALVVLASLDAEIDAHQLAAEALRDAFEDSLRCSGVQHVLLHRCSPLSACLLVNVRLLLVWCIVA
jgi:hypothetical protein